jgi:acetyl-CoA carboxylase biotin carboxyl carrier protein
VHRIGTDDEPAAGTTESFREEPPASLCRESCMDIEEIKTLTDLMVENDLTEIMIRDGEKRILLRRQGAVVEPTVLPQTTGQPAVAALAPVAAAAPSVAAAPAPAPSPDDGLEMITSPMVGTFYAASSPDSPPLAKVGDVVNPDTVICIIEAMKVFNEIKAELSGTIESIEVANEEPVEFGQIIMKVRPS